MEKTIDRQKVIEWCNRMSQSGELMIKWDGGNDEGYIVTELDDADITSVDGYDEEVVCFLEAYLDQKLEHGSWAGDYSAHGHVIYYPDIQKFAGSEFMEYDEYVSLECDVKMRIPENLWFNTFLLEIQGDGEGIPEVSIKFVVENGIITDQHHVISSQVSEDTQEKLRMFMVTADEKDNKYYMVSYFHQSIERTQLDKVGDYLEYSIDDLSVFYRCESEKHVAINLNEVTNFEYERC